MISIVSQNDGAYGIFDSGRLIGVIKASQNPCHAKHIYLHMELETYDAATAADLFGRLRNLLERPLQVMLDSGDTRQAQYLTAGGFRRARRCYETQISADALKFSVDGGPRGLLP